MAGNVGSEAFLGIPVFFYFWSGGKKLDMLYQRGMGSDPLWGNYFYIGMDWSGKA